MYEFISTEDFSVEDKNITLVNTEFSFNGSRYMLTKLKQQHKIIFD
jgi:hypothetical protein